MLRFKAHFKLYALTALTVVGFALPISIPAFAQEALPPTLKEVENIQRENKSIGDGGLPLNIRLDALKEAAVSYGARAGLASRTFEIRDEVDKRARYLDKVYDFNRLLVAAPSGFLIEPPIVSEAINATLVDMDGQQAAVSDKIYNIINNARIVSAPRNWRSYVEREWGTVEPPPDILRPETLEERQIWIEYVNKGWELGIQQANEIFQEDLNLLNADFQGMVRYRVLLSQGMISPPHALQVDRGITGDGEEMRIGDRAVQITGASELMTGFDEWQPASR